MPETSSEGELGDEREVSDEGEYEFQDVKDRIKSSRGSQFNLIAYQLGLNSTGRKFSRESLFNGIRDLSRGLVIHPNNRFVFLWFKILLHINYCFSFS